MEDGQALTCPFCGFKARGDYQIMLHLETIHPEGDISPFVTKEAASLVAMGDYDEEKNDDYIACPVKACGEVLLLAELESHVDMHGEELDTQTPESEDSGNLRSKCLELESSLAPEAFDAKLSHALRNLDDDSGDSEQAPPSGGSQKGREEGFRVVSAKQAWKNLLKMPDHLSSSKNTTAATTSASKARRRLGKSELGPYANEKQMPSWLVKLLQEEDGAVYHENVLDRDNHSKKMKTCPNMQNGIVPVLEQLVGQDDQVFYAYFCDPAVKHVSKLKREGGFCGYRNIQMLSSYIIEERSQGHEHFKEKVPTIFEIQEYIESAWDSGINASGRIETGGIRGTRKYIGTPDAQAMFCFLGIECDAQGLKPKKDTPVAYELLLTAVENYFLNGCTDYNPKVRCTSLPPIYFQHPGHSMTIVGFEKLATGHRNLIVFDPMFHDSAHVTKYVGQSFKHKHPADLLKAYRRGVKYLRKYKEFELLKLMPPKNYQRGKENVRDFSA